MVSPEKSRYTAAEALFQPSKLFIKPEQSSDSEYAAAEFSPAAFEAVPPELRAALIGVKRSKIGHSALVSAEHAERARSAGGEVRHADLETIMVHLDREGREGEDE